jgi:hypothetical protein
MLPQKKAKVLPMLKFLSACLAGFRRQQQHLKLHQLTQGLCHH